MITVSAVYIYPVKSCSGISLAEARIDRCGFIHDRELMVVDLEGSPITQRTVPRLALIRTGLTRLRLVLSAPGFPDLCIPLRRPKNRGPFSQRAVTIWQCTGQVDDIGDESASWLTYYLGVSCRLVRRGTFDRAVDSECIPVEHHKLGSRIGFTDVFPFHIVAQESLADLNLRLPDPIDVNRFRPNILIRGSGQPFCEEHWNSFRIGSVCFFLGGACPRCAIPAIDQETGIKGGEPIETLSRYRLTESGKIVFGLYAMSIRTRGRIRVGDEVTGIR